MNEIKFTKMHGLGNDFILIDNRDLSLKLSEEQAQLLANRHLGIGCDQILLLQPSTKATVYCKILNANGVEAEQCGNGLRCVAKYLKKYQPWQESGISIETKAGIFKALENAQNDICIEMGRPVLSASKTLSFEDRPYTLNFLSLGNPHVITLVDDIEKVNIQSLGQQIVQSQTVYPQGVNVGFVQIINPTQIYLRTYERGAGVTHACGSNACAAVVSGIVAKQLNREVRVHLKYGFLQVIWEKDNASVHLSGPAEFVFDGRYLVHVNDKDILSSVSFEL